ncbi:MAG: RNA methyltransferase [Proteobacteria bacterium]|nr:RNA methyltransferase [Pseudomonadota bacterium]
MGENIGAAARAMMNCDLSELRLVRPRDGWPNPAAESMSSGALEKMPPVQVFDTTAKAVADCRFVLATTARARDMTKPSFTARTAAAEISMRKNNGRKAAVLFGPERSGLTNDDVALSHGTIAIPLNPAFSSLNLGQAVLLVAYEILQTASENRLPQKIEDADSLPVTHERLLELFERLESELETHHFFRNEGQKPVMIRNLRNMLSRAEMTDQEARTFHGIISALTGKKS